MLVEFASVLDALRCCRRGTARDGRAQRRCRGRAADRIPGRHPSGRHRRRGRRHLRRWGQCRCAARKLAEPGGICVSARVQEDAVGRLDLIFRGFGRAGVEEYRRPVRVYRVRSRDPHPLRRWRAEVPLSRNAGEGAERREAGRVARRRCALPDKPSIAVLPFRTFRAIRSRTFSLTAWSRRSSPRCRASAGCS